jgi:murein DD-endopeptidase MepM/ murein hydrolase activator NlpD
MKDPPPQTVEIALPFDGIWGVTQGFDSGNTHIGYAAFAIDFVPAQRIDPRAPRQKPNRLGEFPCYGRPVLAPADGRVVWKRDGGPDHRPWTKVVQDPGNFVIIDHGDAQYTELRHLKAGSVRPSVGEVVRRGQPIARCGNSGTSSTPHLHLGLLGSADPIATRPMRISHYEVRGADGEWRSGDGVPRTGELIRPVAAP